MTHTEQIDENALRRIAAEASADRRTVGRFFQGKRLRPMVEARVRAAIAKLGYRAPRGARP